MMRLKSGPAFFCAMAGKQIAARIKAATSNRFIEIDSVMDWPSGMLLCEARTEVKSTRIQKRSTGLRTAASGNIVCGQTSGRDLVEQTSVQMVLVQLCVCANSFRSHDIN